MNNKKFIQFSLLEAFFTSLVVGLVETYFAAFSLYKGVSAIEAGVLTSAPLVLAGLLQFLLLKKIKKVSVSRWVPVAALIQFSSLLFLALCSYIQTSYLFGILMTVYSLYWLGHFATQPAWNRWLFDLVSVEKSQYYFSLRTRVTQVGIVLGLILGGYVLNLNILNLEVKNLFLGIFALSSILKFISYRLFKAHPSTTVEINFDFIHAKNLFFKYKSFIKSYSLFNFSVYLSAPYVVSYLLVTRHLTYEQFMWVMAGLFLGKIGTTLLLARRKESISPFKLLIWGGILAAPLPAIWPFCSEVWMLFVLHFISGLAWGSWEVGFSLSFFKNLDIKEKIEMISIFNLIAIITQILGTLLAAFILKFLISENYNLLFIISGIIRLACVSTLRKKSFGIVSQE